MSCEGELVMPVGHAQPEAASRVYTLTRIYSSRYSLVNSTKKTEKLA